MSRPYQVTYTLRSSSHVGIVPLDAESKKCREVRALIADRLSTQEEDIALYSIGSSTPIHLEDDIRAFTMLEVVRGVLNTTNSNMRNLTATQQRQRREAREVKAVVSASGVVTTLQRGVISGSGAANSLLFAGDSGARMQTADGGGAASSAPATEEDLIRQMQDQVAQDTGVDGVIRRPQFRPADPGAAPGQQFREPAKGYVCHNCGKGGHHINHCPEARNGFQKVKLLQNPIGIPESMLERCDPNDPRAKFVTRDGVTVVRKLQPGMIEHVNLPSHHKGLQNSLQDVPAHLQCAVCHRAMTNAVKTPCCGKSGCEACLVPKMSDNDEGPPMCPLCDEPFMIDDVVNDDVVRKEIEELSRKRAREV